MTSEKRNILFITLGDQTGANIPIIKVANGLHQQGHNVQVLVKEKNEPNSLVTVLPAKNGFVSELGRVVKDGNKTLLDRDLKYLFNTINEDNSYQETDAILQHLNFNPHIIFVGITFDFLTSTDILKLSEATKAIVYNLAVDMNHFTGGCHFAWDCEGYIKGCDTVKCPAILDNNYKNLAARNFQIKKENIKKGNFRILAGTEWAKKQTQQSLLYKNQNPLFNIAGVVDTDIYNPTKRNIAKEVFELSEDKFYILTGSENTLDERKGYKYFVETLNLFWGKLNPKQREKVEILSVTKMLDEDANSQIRFKKINILFIKDERLLSLLYQSADVFVNCSVEDSGPAMLIESMACGTPVASFDMGAASEYLVDGKSGFIVKNKNTEALAGALLKIFNLSSQQLTEMGEIAHRRILENGSLKQAVEKIEQILEFHSEDFEKYKKTASVALCTYNGEKYIAEQLDSILNQNQPPDEIVICDDISTDKTLEIIGSYQQKFPDIFKVYRNETQLGVVKNFEKAINLCTKDIIFLCDQDDIWLPKKIEIAVRIFNRFPEVEAICHDLRICRENKELTDITMWDTMGFRHFLQRNYQNVDYLFHSIFFGNMVTGAGFCMKKPVVPVVFNNQIPTIIHDYQLAVEYLSKKSLYFHNEYLGLYRQHENQQIGPKFNGIDWNIENIKAYYDVRDPFKNLIFIKNRMRTENVFYYLEATQETKFEKLIREIIKSNVYNSLSPKSWVRSIYKKNKNRKQTKDVNHKNKNFFIRYYWLILNSAANLFHLARIYYSISASELFYKKTSIFRLIANTTDMQKEKKNLFIAEKS